jgi:hypothetical protein
MADDPTDQIVADHAALDQQPDAPPQVRAPDDLAQSEEARKAREAIRPSMPKPKEPEPATPTPLRETGVEENPYARFIKGPQDNGPDNLERTKLNTLNSYYRGTVAGALGLQSMAAIYNQEDPPDMASDMKKARQGVRDQYESIVTSLMRYDMMPSWSGLPQLGAAVGGSVAGGALSPEAFAGWAAKGATWTARTMWAALQQGFISGVTDPVVQILNIEAGAQKEYDPAQTAGAFLFGAGMGGGFHAAGEGVGHLIGQRELRRQMLDLADVDPSVGSSERALWRFDPANGYQERTPEFPYQRFTGPEATREVPPDHSFADTIAAEQERLGPEGRPEEAKQVAFEQEVGPGLRTLMEEYQLPPEKYDEVARHYDRQEGETVEAATQRAIDDWEAELSRGEQGTIDAIPDLKRDLEEAKPPASKDAPPKDWQPAPDQLEEARRLSRGWTPRAAEGPPPQSLVNFVRKNGGLRMGTPEAGDLLAQDIGRQPGLLRKEGKQADQMAQAAMDAGYDLGPPGEIGSGVNVDRFMQMLAEDAGKRVRHYPQGIDTDKHFELQRYNDDTLNHLRNVLGVNPKGMDPRQIAWLLSMERENVRSRQPLQEEGGGVSEGGRPQPGEEGRPAGPGEGEPGGGGGGGRETLGPAREPTGAPGRGAGAVGAEVRRGERVNSAEYEAASAKASAASREFAEAQRKYRAREIGDDEFLAAKAKHDAAQAEFDRAYEKEAAKEPDLIETKAATPEELATRQRAADKEEAEARMRGKQRSGAGQESPEDAPLFGGERQADLLGLRTSRENNPMPGEERRAPDQGVPLPKAEQLSPEQEVRLRSLHALALDLAEKVGVPLRQGRMTLKKASGQFSPTTGVIRQPEIADFETVKHEVGHAIEQKVGKVLTDLTEQHRYELALLDYDQGPQGQRVNEGFAEWMRVRMTNPRAAQRLAPDFYNAFNAMMVQRRPDLLNIIGEVAQAHRAWLEAPSIDVGEAVVRNTIPDPLGIRELQEDVKRDGWAPTASHVMGKFYEKIQDQYTHYVDQFADLERAVHDLAGLKFQQQGGELPVHIKASEDPSILIRSAHLVGNTAMIESRFGMVPHRGVTPEGPGLAQIMNTAIGNPSLMGKWDNQAIERFDQYVTARMSEYLWRLYDEGKVPNPPSPIKPGDAREIISHWETAHPGFKEAANMLQDFVGRMRKKAFDAGLMGADTFAKLSEYEFYVPMRRVFEEGEGRRAVSSPDNAKLASSPIKRRGSERDVDSPLRNIMRNLFTLEQDVRRNEINKALLSLSESVRGEGGIYAERLPASEAHKYSAPLEDMINNRAKEVGIDPDEARTMVDTLLNGEEGPLTGSYWRYETAAARGEPVQFMWENGKPVPIRVMSKRAGERYALHEVMSAAPPPVLDLWVNFMQLGATTLRAGITNSPVFILTNYLKDQFQTALSQPGYIPILGGLKGIKQELAQDKVAVMRAYFGGVMGGSLVGEVQHKFNADLRDLAKQGYAVRHFTSFHGLIEAMQVTEAGTRNSIFERYYRSKLKEGLSEYDAAWEAAHQANDIMDFSRHGDRMAVVRKIIPFLNANIQGQDRYTFRTLIEPFFKQMAGQNVTVRDRENLNRGLYAWAMAGGGGLAFGTAWAALNWEKDAYRDATPEVKGTHVVVPMGGNQVFVMPKPFELGIGFTAGEYLYGMLAKKDPRMAAQMRSALMQAMSLPNPVQNLPGITPALEMSANQNFFTGRPIVPEAIQNKAHPELEYNDRTSSLARYLGKQLGWSPMKVDYAMGAYFGTNGRDLMSLSSMTDQDSPTAALDDVVFARRFIKNSERISGRVRQFWDLMGAKNGKYHDEAAAYRKLVTEVVKRGQDPAQANELLKNMNDSEKAYVTLHEGAKRDGKPAFTADDRRMHPLTRAYEAVRVLNGLATELQTNTLVPFAGKEKLPLTPDARRSLIDEVRTMAGAEMRNAFVVVKEKGYEDRQTFDINTYMDKIRQVSPQVADEIANRYATGKVYSFDAVKEAWPQIQRELATAGTDARISSMTSHIKGAGYEFRGTRSKAPGPVRQPIIVPQGERRGDIGPTTPGMVTSPPAQFAEIQKPPEPEISFMNDEGGKLQHAMLRGRRVNFTRHPETGRIVGASFA